MKTIALPKDGFEKGDTVVVNPERLKQYSTGWTSRTAGQRGVIIATGSYGSLAVKFSEEDAMQHNLYDELHDCNNRDTDNLSRWYRAEELLHV